MNAPRPGPRQSNTDWTRPDSYLRQTGLFFRAHAFEEPRRVNASKRFVTPVSAPVPTSAKPAHPWRPSHMIPPLLGLFLIALLWISAGKASPTQALAAAAEPVSTSTMTGIRARFGICGNSPDPNCVVNGATLRFEGSDIHIAGIQAPRREGGDCPAEKQLALRASERLQQVLNSGTLTMTALPHRGTNDGAGAIHRVAVDGRDLGSLLLAEGHAQSKASVARWCK